MIKNASNISNLSKIDLNLLIVFQALEESRHVTRAAAALNVSQPAISHALARLRVTFGDSLFVKTSKGMVPTPRAVKLSKPISAIIAMVQSDLLKPDAFVPSLVERTFSVHTTDMVEQLLLPELLRRTRVDAPGVKLSFRSLQFSLPREQLEEGDSDLAIAGFFGELPDGFYQQKLFQDGFVSCIRGDHPLRSKKWTIEEFCLAEHLLIAPGGELQGRLDDHLKKLKKSRRVVAGTGGFLSSAWCVINTDCVLTAPARMVAQFQKFLPLHVFATPVPVPPITIVQAWHRRHHDDPEHRWLREKICGILQE